MSGRSPTEIWDQAKEEGERRLERTPAALAATGFVGGADIMLGVFALCATSAILEKAAGPEIAHLGGSLAFGLGFVFLIMGRGELFTENFLVPVAAVLARTAPARALPRLWGITFVANYVGIFVIAMILKTGGVLKPETLQAAKVPAETLLDRDALAMLLSAVIAGASMTLMTWLTHAATEGTARIVLAWSIGFVIALASMNHAVVSFGETIFAYLANVTDASLGDIAKLLGLAVVGNVVGGLGFVTLTRAVQVQGEPD